jgi:hypothetical protein
MAALKVRVEVEFQQIPRFSEQHDATLMDLAIQYNLTLAQLFLQFFNMGMQLNQQLGHG